MILSEEAVDRWPPSVLLAPPVSREGRTCLLGVELHLALGLRQQLDVVRAVDLLGDDSDLVGDGELTDEE